MLQEKYLNLLTDFGFRKLFGEESNKDLLISFLNTLLPEKHQIQDLTYNSLEYQGYTQLDRQAIFDLSCVSSTGERFIVQLHKVKHNFFTSRSLYYEAFPIQQQIKHETDLALEQLAVYAVGILDFIFGEQRKENDKQVIHHIQLKNQSDRAPSEKLTLIYFTLPNFNKTESELETLQDKWLYLFRYLHDLEEMPKHWQEEILMKAFEVTNLSRLEPEQLNAYLYSLKYYRDMKNVMDTAREEGRKKGREEGEQERLRLAKKLLDVLDDATIAATTGISLQQVRELRGAS